MKFNLLLSSFLTVILSIAAVAQTDPVLARIGTQTITFADLNPQAQQLNERLPLEIAELRKRELEKDIAELLFAAEAAAPKTTPEKLLDLKVKRAVKPATDAQIQQVYDANRQIFGNAALAEVKTQIVNYLKQEQEGQLTTAYADSLKAKHKVVVGVDVNSPTLKPTDVLASVGANKVVAERFNERMKPLEYGLRSEVHRQISAALDEALYARLITVQASKTKLATDELIRREVSEKYTDPTDADAQKFYDANKQRMNGAGFAEVKSEILSYLSNERRAAVENDFRSRLLRENSVEVLLRQPAAPVLKISADDDPAQGSATAPVTIVMFTDFQCPACARTHPAIKDMMKTYGDKVRFVVRDYPLTDLHPNAFRAAQAANAAHAQGKFFEYIELLYQNQKALDDVSLKKYAAQVGLNARQFELDLNNPKTAAEIRKDIKDGQFYGIRGTPSIYINGVNLEELSNDAIKKLIETASGKK
jgi:protein-disulfide isomerase